MKCRLICKCYFNIETFDLINKFNKQLLNSKQPFWPGGSLTLRLDDVNISQASACNVQPRCPSPADSEGPSDKNNLKRFVSDYYPFIILLVSYIIITVWNGYALIVNNLCLLMMKTHLLMSSSRGDLWYPTRSPAFFTARGKPSSPVPMFPFSKWINVWKKLQRGQIGP